MRVIAGQFRGRRLKSPPSLDTRPTSDRLRETIFNVIAPRMQGARFLDLCAGSGAVGIEALSRGAGHVTFVDRSRAMTLLIGANLALCGVREDGTKVVITDALEFLRRHVKKKKEPWNLLFFDPPYADDYLPVLEQLGKHTQALIAVEGLLIVEHHHKQDLPEVIGSLRRHRLLKQGETALSFYEKETS